jgi:porin
MRHRLGPIAVLVLAIAAAAHAGDRGSDAIAHDPTRPAGGADSTKWETTSGDWFGLRRELAGHGVAFEFLTTVDTTHNLRGGLSTEDTTAQYLIDASVTIKTDALLGWPAGGTFYLNYENYDGVNPSTRDVGDWQLLSTIAVDEGRNQVSELWYEQFLAGNTVRLKAGKIDAANDFGWADNAHEFLNSGMGFVVASTVFPTYPDPAVGFDVRVHPRENFYVSAGLFDGALAEGIHTGERGADTLLGPPADLFLIGEIGMTWSLAPAGLHGLGRVGAWHHTGSFDEFDGTGERHGADGFYAIVDQLVWRENTAAKDGDDQGIAFFLFYEHVDGGVFEVAHHASAGVVWRGALPERDADVVGAGVSWVQFTNEPGAGFTDDAETAIELFYKVQVTPWLSVKPDLQYIVNPGGVGLDDALVASVRLEVAL